MTTATAEGIEHGRSSWGTQAAALLDPALRGTVRVLGGPGTGKTSLLVDIAAARIGAGADPESVLLLTGAGRLRTRARAALTARLLGAAGTGPQPAVIREPLVRSVHSYAFGVLRLAAQRAGDPPPRLITGAEQDGVIRELLAGDLDDGAAGWPESLRAALCTDGFAGELRDLLARCTERGADHRQLRQLGRLHGRPEWTAAARFAEQYEQVMLLRSAVGMAAPQATVPALGAAELVGAALDALAGDPELLARERARIGTLLVDDAQHLDPQVALLVRVLAAGVPTTVIAGDPNQAVFGFRGADSRLLVEFGSAAVHLERTHRCAPAVARALNGIAALLPGAGPARTVAAADGVPDGAVSTLLAASESAEAALIADTLRRAHLIDGVPWSQMAVLVRSVPRAAVALPRVLAAAGVPVAAPTHSAPLSDNPVVRTLLTALQAAADGVTGPGALELLTGPIGRVDPVTLRQLRRALRRSAGAPGPDREFSDLLVDALCGDLPAGLAAPHARPLQRVRAVLQAASRAGAHEPQAALWGVWQRSGLQRRLVAAADRVGPAGQRAAETLDAVTTLFEVTEQFVARTAAVTVAAVIDHVRALRLPVRAAEPIEPPEAVAILSPHQAVGHEWDVVVIAGLQEGLWPNTIPRVGVLGTQHLLDALDGVAGPAGAMSTRAPVIAEERRLLITAMGRARRRLVLTAVDGGDVDSDELALPSPFFFEVARFAEAGPDTRALPEPVGAPQVLSVAAVVGRLRSVVCAPDGAVDEGQRALAASQLARLAAAGVPGAAPAAWAGLRTVSTGESLWDGEGHVVTLSPSTLQLLADCPLRWLAERHGGTDAPGVRSAAGSLIHALIARPGTSVEQLITELEAVWDRLPFESSWFADNELARHREMLQNFADWRAATRGELTEVGTELDVDGELDGDGPGPAVRVRGRIDRLERDAEGRLVIVDVKTGKTPVTKDDAQRHAQLALYQLAVEKGLAEAGAQPGGGRLVYVAKRSRGVATERTQDALTPEGVGEWRTRASDAAAATAGPQFVARINDGCAHCPMRPSCPAHAQREEHP
jgi:superfamily I DNA/RNA helicase/RecB family exonuclease